MTLFGPTSLLGYPYLPSYFRNDCGIDQRALAKVVRRTLTERQSRAGTHRCWKDGVTRTWAELTPAWTGDAWGLDGAHCPCCGTTICRETIGEGRAA